MTGIPLHQDTMHRARKIALSAGRDWPRKLGAAQTLSLSANPDDTALARHVRTAYSLDLQGLLKDVDPTHRDRSDMVDRWKASALEPRPETSRDVLMGMRDRWGEILLCASAGGVVLLKLTGWL